MLLNSSTELVVVALEKKFSSTESSSGVFPGGNNTQNAPSKTLLRAPYHFSLFSLSSLSLLSLFSLSLLFRSAAEAAAHCRAVYSSRQTISQSGFCHRARRSYRSRSLSWSHFHFLLKLFNPFKHDHCEHLKRHCQPVSSAQLPTVCLMKRKWLRENSVEEKNSTTVFTFASEAETLSKRRKNSASRKLICLLFFLSFPYLSALSLSLPLFACSSFHFRLRCVFTGCDIPSLILHAQSSSSSSSFHCSGCACLAGCLALAGDSCTVCTFVAEHSSAAASYPLSFFFLNKQIVSPAAVCCHNHLADDHVAQKVVQLFMCLLLLLAANSANGRASVCV